MKEFEDDFEYNEIKAETCGQTKAGVQEPFDNVEEGSKEHLSSQASPIQYYYDGDFSNEQDELGQASKRKDLSKKKKFPSWAKALIIIGLILICLVLLTVGCNKTVDKLSESFFAGFSSGKMDNEIDVNFDHDYIGVIYVEGTITEEVGGTYNHEYNLNAIDAMMEDSHNKAMILYVNTPGGGVYASDELYFKIKEYQETTQRPVYSSMQSQATSGGYYISAPCDKIIANRNCWTGSIGVTMGNFFDVSQLLEDLGVKTTTITSGANKSMGSNFEEMTPEQKAIFQEMVDESYEQFVGIVADGRGMEIEKVKKLADGRIYTAKQALENGLIDQIGTFEEAVEEMKKTYQLEDCQVESFESITETDFLSLLGQVNARQKNYGVMDASALQQLVEMNGKCEFNYLCQIEK